MTVISKLPALIGAKQTRENEVLSVARLSKETGVPKQTIYNWLTGEVRRFDADIIEKFCKYFACDVGDLLTIISDTANHKQT
jgi:DNA-binding Xre family transcriptional regulator